MASLSWGACTHWVHNDRNGGQWIWRISQNSLCPTNTKNFNISNQIHSMYQLMQLQYTTYLAWTTFVKIWLPSRAPNTNSWQVDYLVSGCSTSLPLCVLTTSHPSTQISANAVFPLSTKTHPLLRNEWVKNVPFQIPSQWWIKWLTGQTRLQDKVNK